VKKLVIVIGLSLYLNRVQAEIKWWVLEKLVQVGSEMVDGDGHPIQNTQNPSDLKPEDRQSSIWWKIISDQLVINLLSGKQKQIAKLKHLMTWVDNKDFKHKRDIQNERNSMKNKTAKITIRARGYGKSITLNDSQTDLVLKVIGSQMDFINEYCDEVPMEEIEHDEKIKEYQMLKTIQDAIKEGPK